ncbi:uncharacterized protein F5147DRAFT_654658 [Suillus discolor]|uniref:Uncharacterized protein n=1 Tax=Suillus discolor TaxID=1912936 RepID=A0A9P7JS05_9AGAM|nr:uncharacterized protein F5147DRAFT_654658 [Suillus discolor]KAG2103753.1 hypothetical protein F5147DRAFT_654658 [Suillus discolor]
MSSMMSTMSTDVNKIGDPIPDKDSRSSDLVPLFNELIPVTEVTFPRLKPACCPLAFVQDPALRSNDSPIYIHSSRTIRYYFSAAQMDDGMGLGDPAWFGRRSRESLGGTHSRSIHWSTENLDELPVIRIFIHALSSPASIRGSIWCGALTITPVVRNRTRILIPPSMHLASLSIVPTGIAALRKSYVQYIDISPVTGTHPYWSLQQLTTVIHVNGVRAPTEHHSRCLISSFIDGGNFLHLSTNEFISHLASRFEVSISRQWNTNVQNQLSRHLHRFSLCFNIGHQGPGWLLDVPYNFTVPLSSGAGASFQ